MKVEPGMVDRALADRGPHEASAHRKAGDRLAKLEDGAVAQGFRPDELEVDGGRADRVEKRAGPRRGRSAHRDGIATKKAGSAVGMTDCSPGPRHDVRQPLRSRGGNGQNAAEKGEQTRSQQWTRMHAGAVKHAACQGPPLPGCILTILLIQRAALDLQYTVPGHGLRGQHDML